MARSRGAMSPPEVFLAEARCREDADAFDPVVALAFVPEAWGLPSCGRPVDPG